MVLDGPRESRIAHFELKIPQDYVLGYSQPSLRD
jgi:hypothetical protein